MEIPVAAIVGANALADLPVAPLAFLQNIGVPGLLCCGVSLIALLGISAVMLLTKTTGTKGR